MVRERIVVGRGMGGGGVGIRAKKNSPPTAATKKILALFRVFLLTKVSKNVIFCQILRKKAIFPYKS